MLIAIRQIDEIGAVYMVKYAVKYIIIDFKGLIHWIKNEDLYAVDPKHLEEFKKYKNIK